MSVSSAAKELGLDFASATFGSVEELYQRELGRNILEESRLTF